MVVGNIVKFKYHYNKMGQIGIKKGDLGLIQEVTTRRLEIYHFKTDNVIYIKSYNSGMLELIC